MPNTFGLNHTLGGAIGVIALVSILSSGAVLVTRGQLQEATDALDQSTQVVRGLDAFRTAMLNQETGLRGYLITGREGSLEPYRQGRPALDETVSRLRTLIGAVGILGHGLDEVAAIRERCREGGIGPARRAGGLDAEGVDVAAGTITGEGHPMGERVGGVTIGGREDDGGTGLAEGTGGGATDAEGVGELGGIEDEGAGRAVGDEGPVGVGTRIRHRAGTGREREGDRRCRRARHVASPLRPSGPAAPVLT